MILSTLKARFRDALGDLADEAAKDELLELIRRSGDPKFGDYQANFAMSLGKKLGKPPRDVAGEIVAALSIDGFCETPEIAGTSSL